MLEEKKKIDVNHWRTQGALFQNPGMKFDDEPDAPIPGIDVPFTGDTGFLGG
jgi:hypothetical protein